MAPSSRAPSWFALPRPLFVIFFAQVINRMGDFAIPLLTLILTSKLGWTAQAAGLLVMAAACAALLGSTLAGKLSDHRGRKPVLLGAQGMAALIIASCGFLESGGLVPWLLILANFFQGAVRPGISAMIIDLTNQDNRKRAFSLSYLGINLGVAIGPLGVGFLFASHLSWIFWLDALSSLCAICLVAFLVPETNPEFQAGGSTIAGTAPGEAASRDSALRAFRLPPIPLVFATVLWTCGEILFATNVGTWLARHTPRNQRGRFQAIQGLFTSTGTIAAPALGGALVGLVGVFSSWFIVACIALPAALVLWRLDRRQATDTSHDG